MLIWTLGDLLGRSVADISYPLEGASVSIALAGPRSADITLSFDDEAAGQVYPLTRTVKCWLDGFPIFAGKQLTPEFDVVPERRVVVNAVDPWTQLEASYINNRADTDFTATPATGIFKGPTFSPLRTEDQSETVARLIEHASPTAEEAALGVPGHGIIRGSLDYNPDAEVWYPWPQTGTSIAEEIQKRTAIDVELAPVDRQDGVLCELNTHYPSQGNDRTDDVIFEAGFGANNVASLKWKPAGEGVRNRWTTQGESVEGSPPFRYTSNQPESQILFGIWSMYEAQTGRSDQDPNGYGINDLRLIAMANCATHAFPLDNIELTIPQDDGTGWRRNPSSGRIEQVEGKYGVPPKFGPDPGGAHDFWIGDTITVRAYDRPTITLDVQVRVTDAKLTQLANGGVQTELTLNPIPDVASVT